MIGKKGKEAVYLGFRLVSIKKSKKQKGFGMNFDN